VPLKGKETSLDFTTAKPREIEGYFREVLRKTCGDSIENKATVNSSHGSYHVAFEVDGAEFRFDFKKKNAQRVAKAIRALKL